MMDFSLRQLRQHSQDAKESFVFSPASAALQLGALANGASGDTRSEILLALTGTLGLDDLNACSSYFKSRLESVSRAGKRAPAEQLTFGGALLHRQEALTSKPRFAGGKRFFYGYDVFATATRVSTLPVNSTVRSVPTPPTAALFFPKEAPSTRCRLSR